LLEEKRSLEQQLAESNATVESLRETVALLESTGEEMLSSVEEDKMLIVEEMEAKAREQVEEAREAAQRAADATVRIVKAELQEQTIAHGKAEASLKDAEATIAHLRETINSLENAGEDVVKAVEEEKNSLIEKVAELEASLKMSEDSIVAANEQLKSLATEKETLAEQLEGNNNQVVEERNELVRKLSTIESKVEESEKLSAQLAAVSNEKEIYEGELQGAIKRASELEETVLENKALLGDVTAKLQATIDEKNDMSAKLLALKNEKNEVSLELRALISEKTELESALEITTQQRTLVEEALAHTTAELEIFREEAAEQEQQAKSLALGTLKERDGGPSVVSTIIGDIDEAAVESKRNLQDEVRTADSRQQESRHVLEENIQLKQKVQSLEKIIATGNPSDIEVLRRKLEEAESANEELRQEIDDLVSKSDELEQAAEEEEAELRAELETVNAFNLVLEQSVQQAKAELESARLELERCRGQASSNPTDELVQHTSRDMASSLVDSEKKELVEQLREKQSKLNALDDTLADNLARIGELEVSLDEQLNLSSDLKIRLARKSAELADLRDRQEEEPAPLGVTSGSAYIQPSPTSNDGMIQELKKAKEILNLKIQHAEENLRKEYSKQAALEDESADKDNIILELKARLEEAAENSTELKIRLARKSARIAELEGGLGDVSARSAGFSTPVESKTSENEKSRDVPFMDETMTEGCETGALEEQNRKKIRAAAGSARNTASQSFPLSLPLLVEKETTSTNNNDLGLVEPKVSEVDAAIYRQMASLVALAEKKKQRLQDINRRLDLVILKNI